MAAVVNYTKVGFIDKDGNIKIPFKYTNRYTGKNNDLINGTCQSLEDKKIESYNITESNDKPIYIDFSSFNVVIVKGKWKFGKNNFYRGRLSKTPDNSYLFINGEAEVREYIKAFSIDKNGNTIPKESDYDTDYEDNYDSGYTD